ncbi:hypothetical protein YSP_031 [Thermus phage phiYS40]|nr:hypothetical protein YSP_031 [Thermus phage phiYS40]
MELKILKVNTKINWEEVFQGFNKDFIENVKKMVSNLKSLGTKDIRFFNIPSASSLKDISQSFESKVISENSLFFKEKMNITASDLNKKFLTLYLQFEPQYIEAVNIDIYLNKKKIGNVSFSIKNSVIKYPKVPSLSKKLSDLFLQPEYFEGANFISGGNGLEEFLFTIIEFPGLQVIEPIVKILFSRHKPIDESGEVEIVGDLKTLSNFDNSKFKFAISEEPEYHTPYVYRINKYVS